MLLECAKFMNKAAAEGAFTRFLQKGSTADAAAGYLSMVKGLQGLLKVNASRKLEIALKVILDRLRITSAG